MTGRARRLVRYARTGVLVLAALMLVGAAGRVEPHVTIEIHDEGLEPADVAVVLQERVAWHNASLLPRQVEEELGVFRSAVLMPESSLTSEGSDEYVYPTQFAGTFRYRVDTAPVASPGDSLVLRGSVAVRPVMLGLSYNAVEGLLLRSRWAEPLPDGWTYDVDRGVFDDPPTVDQETGWQPWHRDAHIHQDWMPFACEDRWYAVRARLRSPDGLVSGWSPPAASFCHQDRPPPPA